MGNDNERSTGRRSAPRTPHKSGRVSFSGSKTSRDPGSFEEVKRLGIIFDYVVSAGDAIMVSSTSDGGAMVVTVLAGDSREKAYAAGQMELNGIFEAIEDAYKPA